MYCVVIMRGCKNENICHCIACRHAAFVRVRRKRRWRATAGCCAAERAGRSRPPGGGWGGKWWHGGAGKCHAANAAKGRQLGGAGECKCWHWADGWRQLEWNRQCERRSEERR